MNPRQRRIRRLRRNARNAQHAEEVARRHAIARSRAAQAQLTRSTAQPSGGSVLADALKSAIQVR